MKPAAGQTTNKTIVYQHAAFLVDTTESLQVMMQNARIKSRLATQRKWHLGGQSTIVRVWNNVSTRGDLTCGMFHSYEAGKSQLILGLNSDVEEFIVSAAECPKTKDSKDTEFNEGLLFFGLYKNHVMIVQSSALRITVFEQYLNWLLQTNGCLGADNRVELRDPLPKKIVDRDKIDPLKSIILTPELNASVNKSPSSQKQKVRDFKMTIDQADWNPVRDLIRRAGGEVPDQLKLDGDFKPERIQVNLEFKWLGRKKDRAETPMLDEILRAFRDVENPPIKAVTVKGDTIEGNELRLRRPVTIESDGRNPLPGAVYAHMAKYLADLLDKGDIVAE